MVQDTSVAHHYALLSQLTEGNLECEDLQWRNNADLWIEVIEHLVGMEDGLKLWSEKKHDSATIFHGALSLNMLGLSQHQAVIDFLYKHIHLMYFYSHFSTCRMISIVFSLASWFKTMAFWAVYLWILVCESMNYIPESICNSAVNTLYPS